ncbi:MAG: choice-of-anchor D domain-containing protein [Terracidiphilus sp.]|jgi:hypothetical protein
MLDPIVYRPVRPHRAEKSDSLALARTPRAGWARAALAAGLLASGLLIDLAFGPALGAQQPLALPPSQSIAQSAPQSAPQPQHLPPRVVAAQHFLAQRGVVPGHRAVARSLSPHRLSAALSARPMGASPQIPPSGPTSATWQPLGPTAVLTPDFGLVTGRISAVALDPSDSTGNHLYIGTTGGGVWSSTNAGASTLSNIAFNPLTDALSALGGAADASISIGALTVQPGETGVILAGTGDPNDVLDSYYGAGILRSTDGGNTWSLIQGTSDSEDGLGTRDVVFSGEGFAGFAWSTVSPQLVVAAVTQSYEGDLVDANQPDVNCEGLYYSSDSGATWHLATITDGSGAVVQSPSVLPLGPAGNAATSVVWNPVRQLFIAAVRYHGYYQSPDGITWTRLADQPSPGLTTVLCPTNPAILGDVACPIYRGALAVNPQSGDTFAWTVDGDNQDQGLWQDKCAISSGACSNSTITFAQQWSTTALETSTLYGAATIANGNYNLALAAVPSSQDTLVLAGANDLWKCSLAMGCVWRNTTNSTTCMSAQMGEFQHALAWNTSNPQEIFLGNDSGLWRSTDAIAETGSACSSSDSTHFQNLNGSLGSLAEVESLSPALISPYTLMAGLGVNGFAGVKGSAVTTDWPQILSGYGGPVAIDPRNTNNWYVNDQPGVAIYLCSQAAPCTPSAFGTTPVVSDADVAGDGDAMPLPATFLVDPVDDTQLLVATCRVWRGPAGPGWTSANAISPIFSGAASAVSCNGNALIRSMAAMPLASGGEIVYLGMYGSATSGLLLPGHVLSAVYNPASGSAPTWNDLTLNLVVNSVHALNYYSLDISSITIDSHDASGNTVYVTVAGMPNQKEEIETVYRTQNGGSTWTDISSNLPYAPASSLAVDPQSANTVYVATDTGVYFTSEVASCGISASSCWSAFGTGLPAAPAVALSAAPASASTHVLVAATYGRGIWQTPLWTAGTALSAASVDPSAYTFPNQSANSTSTAIAVMVLNIGSIALAPTSIAIGGDFSETDNCVNQSIAPGSSCTIGVTFTPQAPGPVTGEMIIYANVYGGQLSVDLNGAGTISGTVTLAPASESYGLIEEGTVSSALTIAVANSNLVPIPISSLSLSAPFVLSGNSCGATSLAANSDCTLQVEFAPTTTGAFTGQLTLTDGAGTQTVQLNGSAGAPPTDTLNPPAPASLAFPATPEGQLSAVQPVTITNSGGMPLTDVAISISGQFQQTNNCGTQLAAGAVCTIGVVFAPTQLGTLSGTLTIADALKTQTVSLGGAGVGPPVFSVTPSSLTFTNQQVGVASAAQTLNIGNSGASPMANIGFAVTGPAASSYSVFSTTCGALLNNGSSCTAQIVFTPNATGSIAAALVISSSTTGVAAVSVPLNGSGQMSSGLTANPAQLTFAVVAVGQSSSAQPVTITNSSGYAIGSVTLAVSASFNITQNNCTGSLAAGANCTASVVFAPSTGGSATGSLTVSSTGVATPTTVALSGIGFDFTVAFSGPSSQTVAAGQQANYTLVLTPIGSSGTFTFACGTLPTDALCLFSPTTQTLNAGVQGNVLVEISTTANKARLEKPEFGRPGPPANLRLARWGGRPGKPGLWRALPLTCGLLLLPLAIRRRRKIFQLAVLLAILACGISSCTSSGGGTGGTGGSGGGGGGTPTGTYTIPVTVTANGISHAADLVLTVD